ncbi:MAG: ABC transporter substrate-binding protein [Actinomycetota bacterium]
MRSDRVPKYRRKLVSAAVVVALTTAACGGSDDADDASASAQDSASAPSTNEAVAESDDQPSAGGPSDDEPDDASTTDSDAAAATEAPSEDDSDSDSDEPPATNAPLEDEPELTAIDQRGVEVTLAEPPTRVVSVWDSIDAQNLLALGVEPILIGRVNGGRPAPWLDDYAGIETYDLGAGPSIELLLNYDPDLIVTASYDEPSYPLLEEIAPLYVADNGIPWRDELRRMAQLLGRTTEADALIADHEEAIAEAAEALTDWQGASLLVAAVSPAGELTAFTDTSPISDLLVEMGLTPLVASENGSATQSYSFELVSELEGDGFLFVDASGLAGLDFEAVNREFLDGPIVQTIPAADGGIFRISPESSAALRLVNGANLPYLLDELVAVLTAPTES